VIDPATGEFIRREPLIDDDLWVKLQAALDASTKKLSGVRAKGSVLLEVGFCGYCGSQTGPAGLVRYGLIAVVAIRTAAETRQAASARSSTPSRVAPRGPST
jgi:hypothetical protein